MLSAPDEEMENYNTILTEKQQQYWHYHHVKLTNLYRWRRNNNLQSKPNNGTSQIYIFQFVKSFRKNKQRKKVYALKPLNVYSKIDELRQIESIFPQNQVNDLIGLKESINHKIISKLNELDYKLKKTTKN